LKRRGDRFACELIEIADTTLSLEHAAFLKFHMGIGIGCDSEGAE
jgi:hypothetical protein